MVAPNRSLNGFTLIEILIVTAIVAILVAIAVTTAFSVLRGAKSTSCLSNLRSIGQAVAIYTSDHDSLFPPYSFHNVETPMPQEARRRLFKEALQIADDTFYCPLDVNRRNKAFSGEWHDFADTSYTTSVRFLIRQRGGPDGAMIFNLDQVEKPAELLFLHDQEWTVNKDDGSRVSQTSHKDRVNFLYLDWHVKNEPLVQP